MDKKPEQPEVKTYDIYFDADKWKQGIKCRRCRRVSYNAGDVQNRYCARCHVFHDDIWPPARFAWLQIPVK